MFCGTDNILQNTIMNLNNVMLLQMNQVPIGSQDPAKTDSLLQARGNIQCI